MRSVARVVVVAQSQIDVLERSQRVAALGLEAGQSARQVSLIAAITGVLSGPQTPPLSLDRTVGIGVAESETVGEKCL